LGDCGEAEIRDPCVVVCIHEYVRLNTREYCIKQGHKGAYPFQVTVNEAVGMKILEAFGNVG
jgi:hypothetical protein